MIPAVGRVALFAAAAVVTGGALAAETTRISVDSAGLQANEASIAPSVSADGRFVAYSSRASNLVTGDTNGKSDVFVLDRSTGNTTRVSVNSSGVQGNGDSSFPDLSADGRYVAFLSYASNLGFSDFNASADVFVHDRSTGVTTRESVDTFGSDANSGSFIPKISSDGRFVVFASSASDLVLGDTNSNIDVFVRDLSGGVTSRVSVDSSGIAGNRVSFAPAISGDGRFVAFESEARNLVVGDTNLQSDVFVHDRLTGETSRVSVSSSGAEGSQYAGFCDISDDGRFVSFETASDQMVSGDTNSRDDAFVHDRSTGTTVIASVDALGNEGNGNSYSSYLSGDGRYVAFDSSATNLAPGDVNGEDDVFLHDLVTGETTLVDVDTFGNPADTFVNTQPALSYDGRFVAFRSTAANLVAGDTNGFDDVFLRDRVGGCADGNVSDGAGGTLDVLTVNGEARVAVLAVREAVEVRLTAAALGPDPAKYALWLWRGPSLNPRPLVVNGAALGCTMNPTPFNPSLSPAAFRCVLGGLGPPFQGTVRFFASSPARAPWTRRKPAGFAAPVSFTIQGVLEDAGSSHSSGLAVTNAVWLRVE